MRRWLRPRWWPWHLLVLAVAVVFVQFGLWQLSRHDQQAARNALLEARLEAAPRPYPEAARTFDPDAPEGAPSDPRFRPVTAAGTFRPEHEVLLRNRSLEGRPGYHVLTPFRLEGTAGARTVLVDRGWVPYEQDEPGDDAFAPPEGRVELRGRLMPEADVPTGPFSALAPRDPEEGELRRVARADVERLAAQVPFALDPFVIELAAPPSPGGAAALPRIPDPPAPESGPHLGYAAQWFFFAAIAVGGYALLLRQRGRAQAAAERGSESRPERS